MRLRIKKSAKKELLSIDADDAFFAVIRVILALAEEPRPRGYDKVEGREGHFRVWAGRDYRVIYSIDTENREVIIEGVRKKDKKTYK
ncbi:MAG: hypothetical protein A3G93_14925 [Nitrospinae bacterium RIFCSPLOWO2_12_FULL_45_22]|nr:MAG: hypothetical protein A3G93_14925 [Nitrospinae bacterium RIFCSPLOWO2_12_FULL_45_22]